MECRQTSSAIRAGCAPARGLKAATISCSASSIRLQSCIPRAAALWAGIGEPIAQASPNEAKLAVERTKGCVRVMTMLPAMHLLVPKRGPCRQHCHESILVCEARRAVGRSALAVGMVGVGLAQLFCGRWSGPASSLLMYALTAESAPKLHRHHPLRRPAGVEPKLSCAVRSHVRQSRRSVVEMSSFSNRPRHAQAFMVVAVL